MSEAERLAGMLRRFIALNTNDHGYVGVDLDGDPAVHTLTLDGKVAIDDEDRVLIDRLMREAP